MTAPAHGQPPAGSGGPRPHAISVVIPVYQGARTLPALLRELAPLADGFSTPHGRPAVVTEVLLVHDNGPDDSAATIRNLVQKYQFVRPVWLSRNFGQHPATLAGMASSGGEWIVTMDEDGQHDPSAIGPMLDVALDDQADLVYAKPTNSPPHGALRNATSRLAKRAITASAGTATARDFHSYRLILGEVGRSVAAYAGAGAYLDVVMTWVARRVSTCPVRLRAEGGRPSGYSYRTLSSHFWRMVLSSGTKGLRVVSIVGALAAAAGVGLAIYLIVARLFFDASTPPGWPSLMVVLLLCSGAILFSLGVVAEYIGVNVNMAMGRPLYLIVSDPAAGPLGRTRPTEPVASPAVPPAVAPTDLAADVAAAPTGPTAATPAAPTPPESPEPPADGADLAGQQDQRLLVEESRR